MDSWTKRIGLRTLTVSKQEDPDKKGSEFCFVNNGIKIFSMGANYVPQDSLLTRVTPQKLDEMMQQCLDANFNTLRVWGGGVYPDDRFYDLCDENGILVWQDFMIACANVWLTPQFEEEVRAEAEENLKQICHHACIGLICGNNEMESAVLNWGIGNSQLVREDYIRLYERILPQIAEAVAPDIFYWPSSPCSGGGLDDPDNCARGPEGMFITGRFGMVVFPLQPTDRNISVFVPNMASSLPIHENHSEFLRGKGSELFLQSYGGSPEVHRRKR